MQKTIQNASQAASGNRGGFLPLPKGPCAQISKSESRNGSTPRHLGGYKLRGFAPWR
jgi:hypothetical protein